MSGKKYVGQTIQSIESRWARHRWESTQNRAAMAITRAISKYGSESFELSEIETCLVSELDERETFWIKELNTLSPNGYNLSSGGGRRGTLSAESRLKISKANKGRKRSEETRERLRLSHLGQTHSPEQRAAASARMKGRRLSDLAYENSARVKEKTYTLVSPEGAPVTFTNMKKFCVEHGYNRARMNELANGKRESYRGWKRVV